MLLGSVSSQQRFGVTDIKALSVSQLSGLGQTVLQLSGLEQTMLQLLDKSVLQLRVAALFYLENSRKIHPRGIRAYRPKDTKRRAPRERERDSFPFGSSFYMSFPPPGSALCKLDQPGALFVLPEDLTPSWDLPLFYICWLFPSLSFSCCHSGLLFPNLTT